MKKFERFLVITSALALCAWIVAHGASVLALFAAAVLVVSAVVERRSLIWVLLVAVLVLTGHVFGILAAVALAPPGARYDLSRQGLAALRRCVSAAFNPLLAIGAALGGYRLGRRKEALWWMIAWMPATLVAILNLVFVSAIGPRPAAVVLVAVGVLLALDPAPVPGPVAASAPVEAPVTAPVVVPVPVPVPVWTAAITGRTSVATGS